MAPSEHPDRASPRSAVRFGPEDFAVFRTRKPQRRAEALQERILPRLGALLGEALYEVRAVYEVEPLEDSIVSRWPNFRPRRERDLEHLYDSAFAGLGGQRVLGKWHGVQRKDGKPAQILPFRLGAVFDEEGLRVEFHNDWLKGLDAASVESPLEYLEGFAPDLNRLFRSWRITLAARCEDWRPSRSAERTLAAARSSRDYSLTLDFRPRAGSAAARSEAVCATFVRLYPIYDSFIRLAKGERPRLGAMFGRLGERVSEESNNEPLLAAQPDSKTAAHRGAPLPFTGERAGALLSDGPAVTYAMELRGAQEDAFKIGRAYRHEDRARTFNRYAMPELGGISYVPILSELWNNMGNAHEMEQEVLGRLEAGRHPANQEVVTGISRGELEAVWAAAAEEIRRRFR